MARLSDLSFLIAILIICGAIPALCEDQKEHDESPPVNATQVDAHDAYINSLPKDFLKFVENCTKKFPLKCGQKVINAILEKGHVNKSCCHDLVQMGLKCHKALLKVYLGLPEVKDKVDAKQVKSNSKKVFKKCVALDKKKHHDHPDNRRPILP